jgi:hypothetical protein
MSKRIREYLFATHFNHLFKSNRKENRYNYILVNKDYKKTDYNGWLDTSRGVHIYYEFTTQAELKEYMRDEIAKNERKDWVVYRRAKELEGK